MTKRRIWLTTEQKLAVKNRFIAGETPPEIAKSIGVCANNIRNAIRSFGITMRNKSDARTKLFHRKDAFDTITPESAYWIGFLFADGSLYKRKIGGPSLSIGLALRDIGHLEKFKLFLQSEHKITRNSSKIRGKIFPQARFTIRSYALGEALTSHGLGKKSLSRIAPSYLFESRDFWRGVVDGDGNLNISKNKPRLGLCGGFDLLAQFLSFLRQYGIGVNTSVLPKKYKWKNKPRNIFELFFNCSTAVNGVRLLYENADISLDRKAARARKILSHSK